MSLSCWLVFEDMPTRRERRVSTRAGRQGRLPLRSISAAQFSSTPTMELILLFFIFTLAGFLGFELIAKVPSQLHTPLMSGSNAISGITIVGAIVVAGSDDGSWITTVLGTAAVTLAMINVIGGYFVTDRMLGMFKKKEPAAKKEGAHR